MLAIYILIHSYILYLTVDPIAAFESTPGRVPMYFKFSGHPVLAAMWIGCIPFYSNSLFYSNKHLCMYICFMQISNQQNTCGGLYLKTSNIQSRLID